ncbi:MAG: hypothetical protein HYS12_25770 [Planctomycetes bacterium]|nr:hypothetical protein [Planctomycetota bacterium]
MAERTPLVESLLAVIDLQQQRLQQLQETVQQLRDEIALLKGQKPRPTIAPSRLEAPPPAPRPADAKRPGSDKRAERLQPNGQRSLLVAADHQHFAELFRDCSEEVDVSG